MQSAVLDNPPIVKVSNISPYLEIPTDAPELRLVAVIAFKKTASHRKYFLRRLACATRCTMQDLM